MADSTTAAVEAARHPCPLCALPGPHEPLRGIDERRYHGCRRCALIFVDTRDHLSREAQAARYRTHDNGLHNPGYVRFLNRLVEPLLEHLTPAMRGLDYGCGPGPTLSRILAGHGVSCEDYDPLFVDVALRPPYDFVCATECFEHFAHPGREIERLRDLLKPDGYLGIMTELWTDRAAFATWYYTRDPTHVAFFHERTFELIGRWHGFERLPSPDPRVVLLRRGRAGV